MTADWAICAKNSSEFEPADSMSAAMQAFRSESRRECTGLNWSGLVHPSHPLKPAEATATLPYEDDSVVDIS